jgi:hypothetical protein
MLRRSLMLTVLLLTSSGPAWADTLSFSVAVTDLGAPDTFSFSFFIPVLISGPTEVSASVSGTLTGDRRRGEPHAAFRF